METDPWLDPWLALLQPPCRVLELGCDTGRDTAWLAAHGFTPVVTDIALSALQETRARVPAALPVAHDLSRPLPFPDRTFDVVVASLCLHYFDWRTTCAAVAEIARCLRPGGHLLCRLNSTNDVLHGAVGHREIEPNYYEVNGRYSSRKRFFDRDAIDALFDAGWERISVQERTILRYAEPKQAWELILRRDGKASLPIECKA